MKQKNFASSLPKVETHLHLDGTLSPELILRLAQKQNYKPIASKNLKEIEAMAVVSTPYPSLQAVLDVFRYAIDPIIKSAYAVEEIAYELCRTQKEQNVLYFETRFAPTLCTAPDFTPEQAVEAALKGLARGGKEFSVKSRLILCMLRDITDADNETILNLALKFKNKGVAALDLANDEKVRPLSYFADHFKEAQKAGLFTTAHVGEVYPAVDFKTVFDLGINRIGHGTHLDKYPDMMQEAAKRKIPIEINFTSNLRTGTIKNIKEHPAHKYFEKGIPILLSTDDPGVFAADLNHEYELAQKEAGFTQEELKSISLKSPQYVFLKNEEKKALEAETAKELS